MAPTGVLGGHLDVDAAQGTALSPAVVGRRSQDGAAGPGAQGRWAPGDTLAGCPSCW